MNFLKKHKIEIIVLSILVILYFGIRLINILSLPIFTDEAIYIRWAQIAKQDAAWRFISLTDGKQPMFVWLMMISLRLIQDPLLAGRIVSVGAGFLSLIGLYFLGKEIFKNSRIGLIASALYLIFPMALVYDRMALYDGLVGSFAIWSLYLIVLLARRVRLDVALILGMVMGCGTLTKTNAFFSVYLLPFSLILFDWKKKEFEKRLTKWIFFAVIAIMIAYGLYFILRLSPFFHIITEKNAIFVYPLKEWLTHPFEFFIGNMQGLFDWTSRYLTWPFLSLIPIAFFIDKSFWKEKTVLFLWFIIPLLGLGFFGKTIYPRFIFFMTLSLLPLIAYSIFNIYLIFRKKYLQIMFVILFILLALITDYLILTDFSKANIPTADRRQYLVSWEAGNGVRKSVEFFQKEAKKGRIYIATQGTFGLMPFAFEIYLNKNPNITIEGYWPVGEKIPEKTIQMSKKMPTYFFFYQPCAACLNAGIAPESWGLIPVLQFKNKMSDYYESIYKIE